MLRVCKETSVVRLSSVPWLVGKGTFGAVAPSNRRSELIEVREYATSSGKGKRGWLKSKLYTAALVVGASGTGLLLFHYWVKSQVERYSWVEHYYPTNVLGKVTGGIHSLSDWFKSSDSLSPRSPSRKEPSDLPVSISSDRNDKEILKLQRDLKNLQAKTASLEKENYELRKELSKYAGVSPSAIRAGRQKTLIELYAEVLNLLSEFDAKSPFTDRKLVHTLPQVVVVGDQSAGKTSVLEMVASARIFPRGAGEMMTRSPVMVTLTDGPEHCACFNDGNRVFDLRKERDLQDLRDEIEQRMKASIKGGRTISSQPISLTVRGPQLKRMVLVDLPGIISTVTTGMAQDTREQIIKMTKQYMHNPNAIIMCIQDGSVDAERSIVTDLVSQMDPEGKRTIFVLTKVDMAEKSEMKQERMLSILDGELFPMKALGYYAVVTGSGRSTDSIESIQRHEREYFARSKLFQNGMLRESQLTTRNMVNAVTEEFWKMVQDSIGEQAHLFKTLRYNLEAEWRNRYPGERTLDRDDLFELCKADILNQVASLQVLKPTQWEQILMTSLWDRIGSLVLDEMFMKAAQGRSSDEFNTTIDIELHKWAESEELASLCANVSMETMFEQLRNKLGAIKGSKFHPLSQGLREEVEKLSRENHKWDQYNIEQLKFVQMSMLHDKDVRTHEQWKSAVEFMKGSLHKQACLAEEELSAVQGPVSFSDRWLGWRSQTTEQAKRHAIVEELRKFLYAEPTHPNQLFSDELLTVQRCVKNRGMAVSDSEILDTWKYVYRLHFLKQAEEKAHKCQKGFLLREHSPEYSCPEVTFFWRVQQVLKSSSHTLRVQILDREVRQLEQQVKIILDNIGSDDAKKRALIRGEAVDKAEQLRQVRLIQEKLDAFKDALAKQQKRS